MFSPKVPAVPMNRFARMASIAVESGLMLSPLLAYVLFVGLAFSNSVASNVACQTAGHCGVRFGVALSLAVGGLLLLVRFILPFWPSVKQYWQTASSQQLAEVTDIVSRYPELQPFMCAIITSGRVPRVHELSACAQYERSMLDHLRFVTQKCRRQQRQEVRTAEVTAALNHLKASMGNNCA